MNERTKELVNNMNTQLEWVNTAFAGCLAVVEMLRRGEKMDDAFLEELVSKGVAGVKETDTKIRLTKAVLALS